MHGESNCQDAGREQPQDYPLFPPGKDSAGKHYHKRWLSPATEFSLPENPYNEDTLLWTRNYIPQKTKLQWNISR